MKAVILPEFGGVEGLQVAEIPPPALCPNQLRIRVAFSGVNRADLVQRRGLYPPPPGESEILGLEVSGAVEEFAKGVSGFAVGDRVIALLAGGGYASEVCVDAGLVMKCPEAMSLEAAAAIPEVFLTAYHNLFRLGGARAGQRVLVHAGASGVGTAAIQLLKAFGCEAFVTVGSVEKARACEKLGATAIVYREENFADRLENRIDLILDPVGAKYWESNLRALAHDGQLILIGTMSGKAITADLSVLMRKRLTVRGSTLRALPLERKRAIVAEFAERCLPLFEKGDLRPVIDRIFPVNDVAKAHELLEESGNIGKVLLKF